MLELSAFQDAFCAALRGEAQVPPPWSGAASEPAGLSVYRNTVLKGAIDALVGVYSTVEQIVGEDWLRSAAALYAAERPPTSPALLEYGADFPDWLGAFPPAEDTPYLADVARLDWLWHAAYFAADAAPLAPEAFAGLGEGDLRRLAAPLLPSAGLVAFQQNIGSLWLAHRASYPAIGDFELTDTPEQVLVIRPALEVEARLLDRAAYVFLAACAAGESLLGAAEKALQADSAAELSQIVAEALEVAVFARLEPASRERRDP